MKWFCPYCWEEVKQTDKICHFCGKDLTTFHSLSYEDKIILALDHPITQHRFIAIELIGKKKILKAFDKLCNMIKITQNGIESIYILKSLIEINKDKTILCLKNMSLLDNNRILKLEYEKLIEQTTL